MRKGEDGRKQRSRRQEQKNKKFTPKKTTIQYYKTHKEI